MKQIRKKSEPSSLTKHRKTANADYDNYPEKDELRTHLYSEQRGICCYCLGKIIPEVKYMKIEHFKCQNNYPLDKLKYANLLGACKGGEGQPLELQHCDTYKGSKELNYYPPSRDYAIENSIFYGNDGTIGSTTNDLNTEINEVLNLNIVYLKNNRKAVLDGFKDSLQKHKGELRRSTLERWLNDWQGDSHTDNLKPYCMVIVYWLQKRLNR
jgi:uncharacterized protein (TIGR02646 family)